MPPTIIIYQRAVSPHMAGLAMSLADNGYQVFYCANVELREKRKKMGWTVPDLGRAKLVILDNQRAIEKFLDEMPLDAIHICQGFWRNGLISLVQKILSHRRRKYWVIVETIDSSGFLGFIRKLTYRFLWIFKRKHIEGILAIGSETYRWLVARGVLSNSVYDFAYYLPITSISAHKDQSSPYRFIYVGSLVSGKRVDWILEALAELTNHSFELTIVGAGPLEHKLKSRAKALGLGDRIRWTGTLAMADARNEIALADCLILPSRYDGWGAVVSEALLAGTVAVCSDRCGSCEAVRQTSFGGVFKWNNPEELRSLLYDVLSQGRITEEEAGSLRSWSQHFLSSKAGAVRLSNIIAGDIQSNRSLFK